MTQITFLNPDEMSALQGMTLEAKVLYVFELRRYADENGITGQTRRHSYQSFREQLTFVPDWGSKQKQTTDITEGKIRSVLAELERHGLIEKQGRNLVFRLPLATRPQSVQKRNNGGTTAVTTDGTTVGTTAENTTAAIVSGVGTTEGTKRGTTDENAEEQRTSPVTLNTCSSKAAGENFLYVESGQRRFVMPLDWQPSSMFQAYAVTKNVDHTKLTPEILADFVTSNNAKNERKTQAEWDDALVNLLRWRINNPKKQAVAPVEATAPRRKPAPDNFDKKDYGTGGRL